MQISRIGEVAINPELPQPVGGGGGFAAELKSALERVGGGGSFADISQLQREILSAKTVAPRDLILYQIRAAQFGLRVELLSKIGESALSSIRKFQQQGG